MDYLTIILIGLIAIGVGIGGYIRQKRLIQKFTQQFDTDERPAREQVVREIEATLAKTTADGLIEILLKALRDKEISVRILAASTLRKNIKASIRSGKNSIPVISPSMRPFVVAAMLTALKDDDAEIRRHAAGTLAKTEVSEILRPLLKALDDDDRQVRITVMEALKSCKDTRPIPRLLKALSGEDRYYASRALEALCPFVHMLVYGKRPIDRFLSTQHTLHDQDLSHLEVPMPKLKEIIIHAPTCDRQQIESLSQYASRWLDQDRIRKRVKLSVYGAMENFPPAFSQAFSHCRHVDIDTETIVFGTGTRHEYEYAAKTCWQNPDTSHLMLPLDNLKEIIVYTDSYDFHLLERFLTYAVNYVGQKDLKKEVEVRIHGDPDQLPDNIRNNFTNLCNEVIYHT